jgi:hypothetical protein
VDRIIEAAFASINGTKDTPFNVRADGEPNILGKAPALRQKRIPKETKVLLVDRQAAKRGRGISNFTQLQAWLNLTLVKRGYPPLTTVEFATLDFTQQVLTAANHTILIGSHGAGLQHLLWLPVGGTLIELMTEQNTRRYFLA